MVAYFYMSSLQPVGLLLAVVSLFSVLSLSGLFVIFEWGLIALTFDCDCDLIQVSRIFSHLDSHLSNYSVITQDMQCVK